MKRIRSDLVNGIKAPECNYCWEAEKYNVMSMRQGTFSRNWIRDVDINNPKIRCIDIRFSNKCNLKCLSCNPEKSNQLGIEENLINPTVSYPIYDSLIHLAPNLREINFLGGEPLLQNEMYKFMDYLIHNGHSKKINLKFSTNVTVYKSTFVEKLKEFKFTKLGVSIDGYDKRNEYLRFPSKWKVLEKNLMLYRDSLPENSVIKVQQVCSNLSMNGIDDFYNWYMSIDDYNTNKIIDYLWVQYPPYLRCNIIPNNMKDNIKKKLQYIQNLEPMLNKMMQPYTEKEKNQFIEYINRKDKLRGTNILDYCPEFEEWFS